MGIGAISALLLALILFYGSLSLRDAWAILCMIPAILCLLISLVLVSWVVKLGILGLSLLGMQYYCYRHACNQKTLK